MSNRLLHLPLALRDDLFNREDRFARNTCVTMWSLNLGKDPDVDIQEV